MTTALCKRAGLGSLLRVVKPGFPAELLSEGAYRRLEALMDRLPPAFGVIYEFWLKGDAPKSDLQCYFRANEGLALADAVPYDSPVWRAVQSLIRDWRARGEKLYDGFWLEFDLCSGGSELAPRVGFSMSRMRGGLEARAGEVFAGYLDTFRHTHRALNGKLPRRRPRLSCNAASRLSRRTRGSTAPVIPIIRRTSRCAGASPSRPGTRSRPICARWAGRAT